MSSNSAMATGAFYTSNGQVIGPNGAPFVAAGIDVMEGNQPSVSTLQTDFPGINFVRLAIYDYESPTALASYVSSLTSKGIVVELENHNNGAGNSGGSQGTIFTGAALTTEMNWYTAVAAAFKSNPYVWFGTNNEPTEMNSSGVFDPAALSAWQQQTVQTIRATGNNAPVMVEMNSWGTTGTAVGYVQADYSGLHNIIWDMHYYGWLTNGSTDQALNNQTVSGIAKAAQQITSADGTVPVIIGEYGDSTTGLTIDSNANQVIAAVQQSGYGNIAWAWGAGNPGDGLSDGGTGLSALGRQVAAGIAAAAARNPPAPLTPSANDTFITSTTADIIDANGNIWTITAGGQVATDGTTDTTTANVIGLAYVNGTIWHENASKLWWGETQPNASWSPAAGTATSPLPAPPPVSANDTVVKAGSPVGIVDAAGNKWTITTSAQIAVNGVTDTTTGRVTEIAFVNNQVWQENTSNLWWEKTNPTDTWVAGPGTSPLPPTVITISPTQATAIVTSSKVSVVATSGNHMVFITGSGSNISLSGGTNTVTDTGGGNTYVIQAAGKGFTTFANNILHTTDTLDLRGALAATNWAGTASTLSNYLTVTANSHGAVLSISATSGGAGVAIATIDGAPTSMVLAHSIT